MNKEGSFVAGFILGFIVLFGIASFPSSIVSKANNAIDECEKHLPRSQKCHVTAAPNQE